MADLNRDGSTQAIDTTGDTIPDASSEALIIRTEYDGLGRAYRTIDANGHATTTVYDDAGRVIRTVYHDGSFVAYGYDSLGRKVWQSRQLAAGANAAEIEASRTSYEHDDRGQLTAVILPAVADPENGGVMVNPRYEGKERGQSIFLLHGRSFG